jgi:3-phytase
MMGEIHAIGRWIVDYSRLRELISGFVLNGFGLSLLVGSAIALPTPQHPTAQHITPQPGIGTALTAIATQPHSQINSKINSQINSQIKNAPPSLIAQQPLTVRFATFNSFLNRNQQGQLLQDLSTPDNAQAKAVAEIIQRVNPDVLLLQEFDYDAAGQAIQLFQQNYLGISQNDATALTYPYIYLAATNTGLASGLDLDNNQIAASRPGDRNYGGDAFGFGTFPGQYGMVLLSKYPIDRDRVRTFQTFLWKDMPNALLPDNPSTDTPADWYSPAELNIVRLSSKNHWDVPIVIGDRTIHVLASHPTPPVFDGVEDRNGRRNHDEIRLWADYITPGRGDYLYDDGGDRGGLATDSSFVIMGDMNADPVDGDSYDRAIRQILDSPLVNATAFPSSEGGQEDGQSDVHAGDARYDTSDFNQGSVGNLHLDYVLPSRNLTMGNSGVFWPPRQDPLHRLVGDGEPVVSSDHRLVWVDVQIPR